MIKPDIGILVGRFQIHRLHQGHRQLLERVARKHSRVVVFLGCTKTGPNRHNPLDYVTREKMLFKEFEYIELQKCVIRTHYKTHESIAERFNIGCAWGTPGCIADHTTYSVQPLQDKKTDLAWSRELDARIDDAVGGIPAKVTLYGSRDSFAPYYGGKHKVVELDIEVPPTLNATDIRERLTSEVVASEDFRAGQVYNVGQRYPQCIPTVDVAIVHHMQEEVGRVHDEIDYSTCTELLLGRKPEETSWRFIGGHAETGTASYEDDAKKEALEETGLSVTDVIYVGSALIDDWRHRNTENRIKTLLFVAHSMQSGGKGADDIAEVRWFNLDELNEAYFEPEHAPLWKMFKDYAFLVGWMK
jgi:bifunctional NMN adenylyltransferase/nudix hydrolase